MSNMSEPTMIVSSDESDLEIVGDPTWSGKRIRTEWAIQRAAGGRKHIPEEIGEVPPAEGGDGHHHGDGEEEGPKGRGDLRGDRKGVERREERWTGESHEEGDVEEDAAATGKAASGGCEEEESHEEDPTSDAVARGATNTTPSVGTTGGKGGGNGRQEEAARSNVACGTTYTTPKEGG
nr:uncharacterized protein LOC122321517 [Drosophila bipectinata]